MDAEKVGELALERSKSDDADNAVDIDQQVDVTSGSCKTTALT